MGLLEQHYDPALEIDVSVSIEVVTQTELERLCHAWAVVFSAKSVPRRISDATREELALDKKRARRLLHPITQSISAWGGVSREATPEEVSAGAQVHWSLWYEEHTVLVVARRLYLATWAKRTGQLRFGKSAVVRLTQELDWLEYAMRD